MRMKFRHLAAITTFLCVVPLLSGCSEFILFDPKGPVGESEKNMIIIAFALMMIVVLPVIFMSLWFPYKYRESNKSARYDPNWSYSKGLEIAMWVVPLIIVGILSTILWIETHRLDPYKPLQSDVKPLQVEVVSLDWKWLFIYPEQNIAVVNQFVFPVNTPLSFKLTSDTVMTSFFIPQLGSQIYAMGGMVTRLNLMADEKGEYRGHNQQFSGEGFPHMFFVAKATSREDFEAWVRKVKQGQGVFDNAGFEELRKPGVPKDVIYYPSIAPGIFQTIVDKYNPLDKGMHGMHGMNGMQDAGAAGSMTHGHAQ